MVNLKNLLRYITGTHEELREIFGENYTELVRRHANTNVALAVGGMVLDTILAKSGVYQSGSSVEFLNYVPAFISAIDYAPRLIEGEHEPGIVGRIRSTLNRIRTYKPSHNIL